MVFIVAKFPLATPLPHHFYRIETALGLLKVLQNGCFIHKSSALSVTFVVVKGNFGVLALGFEIVGEYLRAFLVANATLDVQVVV